MDGLSFKIRLVDEASHVLKNIGDSGIKTANGIETEFEKVSSSMNRAAKTASETSTSFSKVSGSASDITVQSRLLANALSDEAGKLERAAEKARQKADKDSIAAQSAKEFYESLKKQVMESDNVSDALEEQAAQALRVSESLDKAAKKSEEKANAMKKAADAARNNASAVETVAQADEKIYNSANKISSSEQKVAEALNKTEQEAKEYADAVRKAADESAMLGTKGESTAQLLESAFMALGVERVLSKISDGFIACSKSAIEFESAITGVYKTVDGTDVQLEKISKNIKDMAIEIPSTTTEIARVAESAGQLGIATEDITDFTKVMINLGEATNLSSDEAASSLAKFSNITGMSASNYENLGSAVVALGNNFATTEADIVAMSTRMASAGTLAGLTESDILGLATAMSSVGIEADAGGSAMSKLLSDIQVAVETGNDSLNDFASVAGMTVDQFSDLFENRAVDALDAFITGLNDVERNGQTATVILENMGITEVRLSNAVKSLASNSDGMSSAVRLAGEAWKENTALAQEAGTRYGTLESRLTIAKNAANNLKIAIGDSLNPVVGKLADVGTDAMVWMTDFCDEHQMLVTAAAGSVAALGTAAGAITAVATAAKAAKSAMEIFNVTLSAGKMIGIAGGIAAVGAVIGGLAYAFTSAEDEVEDYNGTLEQCKNELDSTAMAYENVCNMYGANSEAAQNLKNELDMLNAQYQKGGGFAEEYAQKLSENKEAFASLKSEYSEKIKAVDDDWKSGMVAIAQLEALSEKAQITNTDLDLMSKYADYLNDTFNCNIEVNYDTKSLTGFDPNDINSQIEKIAEENRKQVAIGWVKICGITVKATYTDVPIRFLISQKTVNQYVINVRFNNTGTLANTEVNSFTLSSGSMALTGAKAAILKTSSTSSGVKFDLYIYKKAAYDVITVLDYTKAIQDDGSNIDVVWETAFNTSSTISGAANAIDEGGYYKNSNTGVLINETTGSNNTVSYTNTGLAKFSLLYLHATWTYSSETVHFSEILPMAAIAAGVVFSKTVMAYTRTHTFTATLSSDGVFTLKDTNSTNTNGTLKIQLYKV